MQEELSTAGLNKSYVRVYANWLTLLGQATLMKNKSDIQLVVDKMSDKELEEYIKTADSEYVN